MTKCMVIQSLEKKR